MLRKIGINITIFNVIVILAVLIYGVVSVLLSKDILHNGYKIESENKHIVVVESVHKDAYRLVLALQYFLIEPDAFLSKTIIQILTKIENQIKKYKEIENRSLAENKDNSIETLNAILRDIERFRESEKLFEKFNETGEVDTKKISEYLSVGYHIEAIVSNLNREHFKKVAEWETESIADMWRILIFYSIFFVSGGIAVYMAHVILYQKVVEPIKELASATIEFSEGNFDKRVHTNSKTEIGLLYNSFNQMAEKISENDKLLRNLNEELEQKVRTRSKELQATYNQLVKTKETLIRTEKVATIGQIAAGVAHEIKNPLNSVYINIQMLLRDQGKCGNKICPYYDSTNMVYYEINRINQILDEFVHFAKFPEPKFIENDINVVSTEVAELLSQSAKEAGVVIKLSLHEVRPFKFDARQFKEVLINLFQNAIKAMPEGGILELRTEVEEENVIVNVIDTGKGIPEKNISKIFTPFFSTSEKGLGLGLSIVQRIVESHGGTVSCTSTVGKGSVFDIVLPLERG